VHEALFTGGDAGSDAEADSDSDSEFPRPRLSASTSPESLGFGKSEPSEPSERPEQ
jgi:hypothetical protein